MNSFAIFFGIFLPRSVMNGIRDEIFFVSFLDYLIPSGLEIMPERGFLIFWILLLFFSEFSSTGRVWAEFEPKLFRRFLGLSYPVLAENNTEKKFFNFLSFFAIFFGIFLPRSSMNGIRDKIFFFTFSTYLIPFWLEIMPGRGFIIFWTFLLFFSEFYCPGWVRTEFGTNIFFSLSQPISSRFG